VAFVSVFEELEELDCFSLAAWPILAYNSSLGVKMPPTFVYASRKSDVCSRI
jgi:hypothetical protein